jgi:tubulin-specific chaperone A
VLQESIMMVPQTLQRLETAFEDLSAYLQENEQDISDSEELKAAKELIAVVKDIVSG